MPTVTLEKTIDTYEAYPVVEVRTTISKLGAMAQLPAVICLAVFAPWQVALGLALWSTFLWVLAYLDIPLHTSTQKTVRVTGLVLEDPVAEFDTLTEGKYR